MQPYRVEETGDKMIKCVAVIIKEGNKFLVAKRTDTGTWASPGGHMKEGETPREAIIRETLEEVNTTIINPKQIGEIEFETPEGEKGIDYLFLAEDYSTEPKADGKEMKTAIWVDREELDNMNLYEPFKEALEIYEKSNEK